CIRKIQRADFRPHFQMNQPIRLDSGSEEKPHPEGSKLNGDDGRRLRAAAARRDHGKRKFASGEKTGFMAADGNQVWLGKNLEQVLVLEQPQCRSEIKIGPERKKV